MARRDTYRDYITAHEIMDAPDFRAARRLESDRITALFIRSGAHNVISSALLKHTDFGADAVRLGIVFRSGAWTGRSRESDKSALAAIYWLVLYPLIKANYALRRLKLLPDKMFWADRLAFGWGFHHA